MDNPVYTLGEMNESLPESAFAAEVMAMNQRTARRREQAPKGEPVKVAVPAWASWVVDTGDELLAIHKETLEPYPMDVHADLGIEDHAYVVVRRLLKTGATAVEAERVARAFGLDDTALNLLIRQIRTEVP